MATPSDEGSGTAERIAILPPRGVRPIASPDGSASIVPSGWEAPRVITEITSSFARVPGATVNARRVRPT